MPLYFTPIDHNRNRGQGRYQQAQQDFVDQAIKRQLPSQQVELASKNQLFQNGMSSEQRDKINAQIRVQRENDFNLINSSGNDKKFRELATADHEKFMSQEDMDGKTNADIYKNKGGVLGEDGIRREQPENDRGRIYTNILNNANIRSNEGNASNDKQNVENLSSAKAQLAFDAATSVPVLKPLGILAKGSQLIASRLAAKAMTMKSGTALFMPGAKNALSYSQKASSPLINNMASMFGTKGMFPSLMTSMGVSKMGTSASNLGDSLLDKNGMTNQVVQAGAGLTQAASNFIGFNALLKPGIKIASNVLGKGAKTFPGVASFFENPAVKMGTTAIAKTAQFGFASYEGLTGVDRLRQGKTKEGFESLGNAFGISVPNIQNIGKGINKLVGKISNIEPIPDSKGIDITSFQKPSSTFKTPETTATIGVQKQNPVANEITPPTKEVDPRIAKDLGQNTPRSEPTATKEVDPRIAKDAGKNTSASRTVTKTQEPEMQKVMGVKTPEEANITTTGKVGGAVTENKGGPIAKVEPEGKGTTVTTTDKKPVTTTDKTGGGKPPEPPPRPIPKGFPPIPSLGGGVGGGGESVARPKSEHTSRGLPTQADPSYRETSIEINYFSEMGF